MNKSKVTEYDYINFLIGTQKVYSCTESERVHPDSNDEISPAHDSYIRQLHSLLPTVERLWLEVSDHVDLSKGYLLCDDSTLAICTVEKLNL
jgi:putative transposase